MKTNAYQDVARAAATGRALEAGALMRSAVALNDAMLSKNSEKLVAAANMNAKLWLLFYSEIETGNVKLPIEVANNIASLAAYVAKVTVRAMAGEDKVLETLISINKNISAGLSMEVGATEVGSTDAAPAGSFATSA